jgi:hypothetical protein
MDTTAKLLSTKANKSDCWKALLKIREPIKEK